MNAFHDLAEMTRDYGLVRYFVVSIAVVTALMVILFLWGHVPDETPAATPPATAPAESTAPTTY